MYVSCINSLNSSTKYNRFSKKTQKIQENPSFKKSNYMAAFKKYFDGELKNASNERTYRELMSNARLIHGAYVDEFCKKKFGPTDYNKAMNALRENRKDYSIVNDATYRDPKAFIKKEDNPIVSVMNIGYQGNILEAIFGRATQDTRICFHGLDEYKNCVICLGRNNKGEDYRIISYDGVYKLLSAILCSKL